MTASALREAQRSAAFLALGLRNQADRRAEQASRARLAGAVAVVCSADALDTDAALLREASDTIIQYHAMLDTTVRERESADLLSAAREIGLEPVV